MKAASQQSGIPRDAREVYLGADGEPIAFCPADSFGATDLARVMFYRESEERLRHFARRLTERGLSPDEAMIVCVDVDDPTWSYLAEALMPGYDWQAIRDRGERPVARGLAMVAGIAESAAEIYPAVGDGFRRPLPPGRVRCAVFAAGGVSIFDVTPAGQE